MNPVSKKNLLRYMAYGTFFWSVFFAAYYLVQYQGFPLYWMLLPFGVSVLSFIISFGYGIVTTWRRLELTQEFRKLFGRSPRRW